MFIEARDLNENRDFISADSLLNIALELDPDFALAHFSRRDPAGKSRAFQLIDQVSSGEAFMIKAGKALRDRNYELINIMVDSLLMLHPRDVHCLHFAGGITQDEEKKMEFLNKAIKLDRNYAAPYLYGGMVLMVLDDYETAKEYFNKYLDLKPYSGYGLVTYAHLLRNTGHEDEALILWLRAIRVNPTFFNSYLFVIWIYYRRSEIDLVSKYTDLMYDISKTVRFKQLALQWKANVQLIRGNLNAALELMDQIIQLYKENDDLRGEMSMRYLKGWFALRGNQPELALSILESNLQMANQVEKEESLKTSYMIRNYGCLSIIYGEIKDTAKAGEFLSRARELFIMTDQSSDSNYMSLFEGVYALNMGDYESAKAYLSHRENQWNHAYQYYIAETYRLTGQNEEAIKHYRAATNKDYHLVNQYWTALFYNESMIRLEELTE